MIIVPIGHERGFVSRLPWVTLAIAALCILVQVRASIVEPPIEAEIEQVSRELLQTEREIIIESTPPAQRFNLPGMGVTQLPQGLADFGMAAPPSDGEQHEETEEERLLREAKVEELKVQAQALSAKRDAAMERLPAMQLGYRPARGGFLRMISSAFAHGGWMHLLGNLLFLYLVGCNIEDRWGRLRYALFYFGAAIGSALSFRLWHPGSEQALVGASGAIAAVMGAFTVCLGSTRIRFFYAYWLAFKPRAGTFFTPAWVALPLWFAEQALMSWFEASKNMGVAYSAHVGGFVIGLAVALVMRFTGEDQKLAEKAEFSDEEGAQWSDDPLLAEAKGLGLEGHNEAALKAVEELLTRSPQHAEARQLALKFALELEAEERVRHHAGAAFTHWTRAAKPECVLDSYRKIREQHPDLDLGESALRSVATACARDDAEPLVTIDVAGQLIRLYPGSAMLPRAMWSAALAQERLTRDDLAQRTLENLAATYPMDPFGERARRKLEGESLRPPRTA